MSDRSRRRFEAAAAERPPRRAPYTFVEADGVVLASPVYEHTPAGGGPDLFGRPFATGLCGSLAVTWTAETPLLVGGHDNNTPFTYRGVPAIPGATLRGLVRAILEPATWARLAFIDDRYIGFRDYDSARWREYGPNPQARDQRRRLQAGWLEPVRSADRWTWKRPETIRWQLRPCPPEISDDKRGAVGWIGIDIPHVLVPALTERLRRAGRPADVTWQSWLSLTLHAKRQMLVAANLHRPFRLREIAPDHPQRDRLGTLVHAGPTPDLDTQPQARWKRWEAFFVEGAPTPGTDGDADGGPAEPPAIPLSAEAFRRFHEVQRSVAVRDLPETPTADGDPPAPIWQYWCWLLHHPTAALRADRVPVFFVGAAGDAAADAWPTPGADQPFCLSLTRLMRLPYRYGIGAVAARQQGGPDPLNGRLDVCEALFGHVPDDPPEPPERATDLAWRSRVAFGMARMDGTEVGAEAEAGLPAWPLVAQTGVTMQPRPSFYPFYVSPPEAPAGRDRETPFDWGHGRARLAGRKRYPARDRALPFTAAGGQDSNQVSMTAHFLAADANQQPRFSSEIRFHNLLPEELGALLFALSWGDLSGAGPHRHMIGRGKAYGYGQVKAAIAPLAADGRPAPERSWIVCNDGSAAPALQTCLDRFKDWLVQAWASKAAVPERPRFEDLRPIRCLLALADARLGAALGDHLQFPAVTDPRLDPAERIVKGYQGLKQKVNEAYLSAEKRKKRGQPPDWPDPEALRLPPYPTDAG